MYFWYVFITYFSALILILGILFSSYLKLKKLN